MSSVILNEKSLIILIDISFFDHQLDNSQYFDIFTTMEITIAIERLGALAQESRLSIFRRLIEAGNDGLAAGELSEDLDIPPPTLSFHLKDLNQAGLINSRRESRSIIYKANYDAINDLIGYLKQNCCKRPGKTTRKKSCC